jgi:hypothetical protein
MLSLETRIQQVVKVKLETFRINDLVGGLPELGRSLALQVGAQLLDQVQAQLFASMQAEHLEIVCTGVGWCTTAVTERCCAAGAGRAG